MNKFEILAWAMLISLVASIISGVVVLWWHTRKEAIEE
ncbi:TPA: putative phage replication protein [Acinetobacter baumannii]|nr:putative phage replication protein [Acinetobacter baumannii]